MSMSSGTHNMGPHHPVQCCGQLHHYHVSWQPKHDSLGQGHGGGVLDQGGQDMLWEAQLGCFHDPKKLLFCL